MYQSQIFPNVYNAVNSYPTAEQLGKRSPLEDPSTAERGSLRRERLGGRWTTEREHFSINIYE